MHRRSFLVGGPLAAVIALLASGAAQAQVLGQYNVLGLSGTPASAPASNVASGLSFSSLLRGPGLTVPTATNNAFNSSGFNNTTTTLDISSDDYVEFIVTNSSPATQTITFDSIVLATQRSGTGPALVALAADLGGGFTSASVFGTIAPTNGSTATDTISMGGATFTSVAASTIRFRLYGYNASATGGTFRISGTGSPTGLVVNGTVNTITPGPGPTTAPEPGTLALLGLGGIGMVGVVARKRKAN
jgi:hypothetical protein